MAVKDLKKSSFIIVLFLGILIGCFDVRAEEKTSDIEMVVGSSCYTYTTRKATTKYRADYLTFGESVPVVQYGSEWSTIHRDGKVQYIKTGNIGYQKYSVIKNRVMVSPGAYPCATSRSLGYVYYGTNLSVLGETTTKKGVTYVHCIIEKTYKEDGVTVKGTKVEGYINKTYTDDTSIPKVVNMNTSLFRCAFGNNVSSERKKPVAEIYMGEQVEVLMSNKTWSKVRYQDGIYYMYTSRLDPLQMQVLVNRVMQTYDAKPGSGFQHYVYWNSKITVLDTYSSDKYGIYYYCKIGDDYGFVREYSSNGIQYVGYQEEMITNSSTKMYAKATDTSPVTAALKADEKVVVAYSNDTWALVIYKGQKGYILRNKLVYPQRTANGAVYRTGYGLYKENASGNIQEKVYLIAEKEKYGYSYVKTENGSVYWMKRSSLNSAVKNEVMYTLYPSTTLHTMASNDSAEIYVPYMTKINYMGEIAQSGSGAWVKVEYEGKPYYIWKEKEKEYLTKDKSNDSYKVDTRYQEEIINLALDIHNNWDTKYAHGQSMGIADSDGRYGFDCSGFASYVIETVMKQYVPTYDISANLEKLYKTETIYRKENEEDFAASVVVEGHLDQSKLRPGDVLFFKVTDEETNTLPYNHCGIYLGNNEFIHCSSSWGGGVRIMPLTGLYEEGFVAAKRFIPE